MNVLNDNKKFYIKENDKILAYISYEIENNVINILSTFVDESLRGKGIAKILMQKVIEFTKKNNYKIIPTCSYAKKYLLNEHLNDLIYYE